MPAAIGRDGDSRTKLPMTGSPETPRPSSCGDLPLERRVAAVGARDMQLHHHLADRLAAARLAVGEVGEVQDRGEHRRHGASGVAGRAVVEAPLSPMIAPTTRPRRRCRRRSRAGRSRRGGPGTARAGRRAASRPRGPGAVARTGRSAGHVMGAPGSVGPGSGTCTRSSRTVRPPAAAPARRRPWRRPRCRDEVPGRRSARPSRPGCRGSPSRRRQRRRRVPTSTRLRRVVPLESRVSRPRATSREPKSRAR